MSKKTCEGNCDGLTIAVWKVTMDKAFRKNYRQKHMYFCDGCVVELLDGFWTGGGPNGSDVNKINKIKRNDNNGSD